VICQVQGEGKACCAASDDQYIMAQVIGYFHNR
jgi:hypothetical protein